VLLVGESGTSKTATSVNFLRALDREKFQLLEINFSSRTNSLDVQRNLEANVEKRTKVLSSVIFPADLRNQNENLTIIGVVSVVSRLL